MSQDVFARTLYVERKRSERSGRRFVLMLLEAKELLKAGRDRDALDRVLSALARSTRDTDIKGWYNEHSTLGVIFTEVDADVDGRAIASALLNKVNQALAATLTLDQINEIRIRFRVFPQDRDASGLKDGDGAEFYNDLLYGRARGPLPRVLKRCMDIFGSILLLILCFPVIVAIALGIKFTSSGPVLFQQKRFGQYGRTFDFLKFRSMQVNNDPAIHRDYIRRFIVNGDGSRHTAGGKPVYKLTEDPRVTPFGRFLRKTSLDELPQLINVLKGEMSLVGPRPPVPYEVECYHLWHRTRLLAAKPGITGLWQVSGRSRVKFDDMVRMDLRYASSWSLWLDVKILMQTPQAVFSGNGAH